MEVTLAQYPKYRGMFIHYDEIRLMHGCELCSGPFETAGELLAWHAQNASATIRAANGGFNGTVGTWDDMCESAAATSAESGSGSYCL